MASSDFDTLMAALKADYLAGVPGRIDELAAALGEARRGDAAALQRAWKLAHRIHGTAGSYGLTDLSLAAGQIESVLLPGVEGGSPPSSAGWKQIDRALASMRQR